MPVFAAYDSWNEIVDDMQNVCDEAYALYLADDADAAHDRINDAYFGYYEKFGFEKTVMASISGSRAAQVEYQFSLIKKAMRAGAPSDEIRDALDVLITYLREDANRLDGTAADQSGGMGGNAAAFFQSLLIIMRDGFEAILIVGAIIAYLVKSGNKQSVKAVYIGILVALAASVALAVILNALSGIINAGQEVIEGVTMLIAVGVLFYVSNWMVSKSQASAWNSYIEGKVQGSVAKSSLFSLAFAAFLAVFREGAEIILFYMALLSNTKSNMSMIWLGLAVGLLLLVVVYLLIRVLSMKMPIKPFFIGTSVLLSAMAISFTGSAVNRLQLGDIVGMTPIRNIPTIDLLGIYPTLETLMPQALLLTIILLTFAVQISKTAKLRGERRPDDAN
ncbi:MAG: FTR1 family iron permease [Clostridiales Family XIII bacterium]|nr:FTR1 family iron permease [Clostridiales Family XIII bacterium]